MSIGAVNNYKDGKGSLIGTAVLIRTSRNIPTDPVNWIYRPMRVDVLLAANAILSDQVRITSFDVTLYADDGSSNHNPAAQLAAPLRMTVNNNLAVVRGTWFQQDVSTAGWPNLDANTYYWIAVTPATTIPFANGQYNGAVWVGLDDTISPNLPPTYAGDTGVFKARQIVSQRFANDALFAANSASAVTFMNSDQPWANAGNGRFTDFASAGSNVRYGIQLLGWQISPTPSNTPTSGLGCAPRLRPAIRIVALLPPNCSLGHGVCIAHGCVATCTLAGVYRYRHLSPPTPLQHP